MTLQRRDATKGRESRPKIPKRITGLAAFIRQDLKHRILSDKSAPDNLTLIGLSHYYGVSMTPVRTAINDLVEEGIIRKRPNGRLALNPPKSKSCIATESVPRPPTAEDWNRILIKDVMLASLEGNAIYLREETLARKNGVGRSVIRQALNRLAGAGLLEHVPRCGWLVSPLREDNLHAYLEIREMLELKALDLARPHFCRERLQQMLNDNSAPGKGKPPRMDNRLHQYWIDLSGNRYIQGFFRQHIAEYYTLLFLHAAPETSVVARMAGQHRQILEALLNGHWARARAALSEHIWEQERILKKLLEQKST